MLLCLAYTARGEEIEKDTAKIRNVELNEVVVQSFKQQRDLRLEPLSASAVTVTGWRPAGRASRRQRLSLAPDFPASTSDKKTSTRVMVSRKRPKRLLASSWIHWASDSPP